MRQRHLNLQSKPGARVASGFSLLELIAVVTLMGVLSVVAIARLGPSLLGDVAAHSDARRLALDLIQLRRRAIATGDNHYLLFTGTKGGFTGYRLYRASGGSVEIDSPRVFPAQLNVTPNSVRLEFNFEGQALAAYQVTFTGPVRSRRVDVAPLTGAVRVTDL